MDIPEQNRAETECEFAKTVSWVTLGQFHANVNLKVFIMRIGQMSMFRGLNMHERSLVKFLKHFS